VGTAACAVRVNLGHAIGCAFRADTPLPQCVEQCDNTGVHGVVSDCLFIPHGDKRHLGFWFCSWHKWVGLKGYLQKQGFSLPDSQ
jgi:hypothetical protein